jgi:non-specific serine/threonine protein kinase/serine/threonine-protein kinase
VSAGDETRFEDPDATRVSRPRDGVDARRIAATREALEPGAMFGPFRIVRALGEGGMGQVHLAEQVEPLKRRVALKLIRHQIAGPIAEAYFEVERQALAQMNHPAIATIHDAGRTDDGYPWFAMEWIDGEPLDVWCRKADPDRRSRVTVVAALARGAHHAHQRGIVHRDLKPGNVLVEVIDGRPQPKIIDFGVALGIGGAAATAPAHERVGTGPFMSPEQLAGDLRAIDTRTDVYAIGIVLLQLLLPGASLDALGAPSPRREELLMLLDGSAAGDTLPEARRVLEAIPRELRAIVRRAIDPDRELRYPSAMALAEDLERHLEGRPVEAMPASRAYRARKFAGRHRLALGAAGAVLVALVGGLVAALHGFDRASREAERANAVSAFLRDILTGADPDRARDLDKTLMREILDSGAGRARSALADRPEVLADVELTIADAYLGLSELQRAVEFSRAAWKRLAAASGPSAPATLEARRLLARALADDGAVEEAEAHARAAIVGLTRQAGPSARQTLLARQTLGWTLREAGRSAEARDELADVATLAATALGAADPVTLETRFMHSIAVGDLGGFDEAAEIQREIIAVRTRTLGPESARVLTLRNSLAVSYLQARRFPEAEAELEAILPITERVYGPSHSTTLGMVTNLAGALRQQGTPEKVAESGPYYRRAADGFLALYGPAHPRTLMTRSNLGNFLLDTGEAEAAYAAHRAAVDGARDVLGPSHPALSEMLRGLGRSATATGRYDEAEAALHESLAIRVAQFGADDRRTRDTREALAALYEKTGRAAEAERLRRDDGP